MCGCGTSLLDDKMPFSRGADTTHRPPRTNRQSLIGWLFRLSIVALYDTCLIGSHGIYVDPTSTFDVFGDPSVKPRIDPTFPFLAQIWKLHIKMEGIAGFLQNCMDIHLSGGAYSVKTLELTEPDAFDR
ncbi:hypothetical protein OIU85_027902 [Salix viminalis]|uniref:Uncharacterized protein n=1 Tax=Salix viminalis TaxID=40686 RepID=A0A9Q0QJS2_SALVM|nr:hypothetical protein OIU85_027902 [Salix viminalis]